MEQAIMATGVVLVGLVTLGLIAQVMNQVTTRKALDRMEKVEHRVLTHQAKMMADLKEILRRTPEPVTMEDLDRMVPMTDQEVLRMIRETPGLMVDPDPLILTEEMLATPETTRELDEQEKTPTGKAVGEVDPMVDLMEEMAKEKGKANDQP